ncbi:hypothetical protein [Nocardioides sp. J54]|uniref:hypothetical protein n=1 Tax=Nocardioides sp. J54 TaxID=935866 RepID=UPI000685C93C|nr:hypothetical protein [Nocardioides sp. J54]
MRDLQGGGNELPPLITRLVVTALEADQLAPYRLVLDLAVATPPAYRLDAFCQLLDREPCFLARSTEGSARVVPDR